MIESEALSSRRSAPDLAVCSANARRGHGAGCKTPDEPAIIERRDDQIDAALTIFQTSGSAWGSPVTTEAELAGSPWLLVRTKPKQEALALRFLAWRGLTTYCPRILEPPSHRRAPRGPVPVFPAYVFCRGVPEEGFSAITYSPGVRRIVRFGERIAMLDDADIQLLKQREGDRGYLVVPRVPPPRRAISSA